MKNLAFLLALSLISQPVLADGLLPPKQEAVTQEEKGAVQAQVTKVEDLKLFIDTEQQEVVSKLVRGKLSAYKVTVENRGKTNLQIISADIPNGMNGQQAYEYTKRNTAGRALGWGVGLGILSFGAGLLLAGPITAARNSHKNKVAREDTVKFDSDIQTGPLPVGGSVETYTLVPLGAKPKIRVTFKDEGNGDLLFASY